jgi:hypothetical protein
MTAAHSSSNRNRASLATRDYSPASATKRRLLYGASQAGPTRRSRKTRACGEEIVDSFETASELVATLAGEFSIVQACIKIEIRIHNHNTAPDTDPVWNVRPRASSVWDFPAELLPFRTHDHTCRSPGRRVGQGSCLWTQAHTRKLPQVFRRQLPSLALGREFNECPM